MENLIYILLVIVWVIYNIYKASLKLKDQKKASPHPNTSESSPESDIKTLLEEILTGRQTQPAKTPPVIKEEPRPKYLSQEEIIDEAASDTETIYNKKIEEKYYEQTNKPIEISENTSMIKQEKILVEEEDEKESGIDFDISKAIIYSEILKRPVY